MLRNTTVISISLPPKVLAVLERLTKKNSKTRSEVIKELLIGDYRNKSWEQIFTWGRQTKEKFNIKSEEDIIKIIHD